MSNGAKPERSETAVVVRPWSRPGRHTSRREDNYGLRRWFVVLGALALAVSSCGSDDPAVLAEPVIGGDLVFAMQPGDGPGIRADQLVEVYSASGMPVEEGTATHLAWFDRTTGPDAEWFMKDAGPVHAVSFTLVGENPRGGGPWVCIMFGGGGGCNPDITKPQIHNWGRGPVGGFLAQAFGGADAAEAVITTESGNAVSVLAAAGYAHAEWPPEWGVPETVVFYTNDGERLLSLDFDPEMGG